MASLPSIEVLQRQQCEITASLRLTINSTATAEQVAEAMTHIDLFMRDVHDAAEELQIGADLIIQALLTKLQDSPTDFDKQGGTANVPMHQNKVLDRSKRVLTLDTDRVKDTKWILKQINENLPKLVATLRTLREVVKLKVEDASDIKMARSWSSMATTFFRSLLLLSPTTGGLYEAWCAVESGTLPSVSTSPIRRFTSSSPKAQQILDFTPLLSLAAPFQDRLNILGAITAVEAASEAERVNFLENPELLGNALAAQLKDNRSQILKAVCHSVRRVVASSAWAATAAPVTTALISRLSVSNKMLGTVVAGTLQLIASTNPPPAVITVLCGACETSQIAAIGTRCAEALTEFLSTTRPEVAVPEIISAAEACSKSRHATQRNAAKGLSKLCTDLWGTVFGEKTAAPSPARERVALRGSPSPRHPVKPVVAAVVLEAATTPTPSLTHVVEVRSSVSASTGGVSSSGASSSSTSPNFFSSPDAAAPGRLRGVLAQRALSSATNACGSPVASLSLLKKRQHSALQHSAAPREPRCPTDSPLLKKQRSLETERTRGVSLDMVMADVLAGGATGSLPVDDGNGTIGLAGGMDPVGLRSGVRLL